MRLNIGCGGGDYEFKDFQCDVNMDVETPRANIVNFVRGDALLLPFRNNTFDEIYASHLIEHLADPVLFFRECHRCLKEKGAVHVWTPNFLSVNVHLDSSHMQVYNVLRLMNQFKQVGFMVILPFGAGSRFPSVIRKLLHIILNLMVDELYIKGIKT